MKHTSLFALGGLTIGAAGFYLLFQTPLVSGWMTRQSPQPEPTAQSVVANTQAPPRSPQASVKPHPSTKPQTPKPSPRSEPDENTDQAADAETSRLVINLSRRQVSLYSGKIRVKTYPIAVGRDGWETPIGRFQVQQMVQEPTWINPLTDAVIPGGAPDNPLGDYWIGFWTDGRNWVGFHGTPDTQSVGKAASHGCIRMYNRDVEELFYQVSMGTPVIVQR